MTPVVSIIIPVYNAEQFLHRTIRSVLCQTFTDWELVLVDDGSPDNSGLICDEYAANDNRVHIIHKPNEGVSAARNTGIEIAKGEWCCFIDSDDWVNPEFLENFGIDKNSDSQLLMQSFVIDDEVRNSTRKVILPNKTFDDPSSVVEFLEKYPGVHNGFIWHRLFRLDIIKNRKLQFPLGISFAEDGWFFLEYMQSVRKSVSTSAIGNHYIIRKGSLTSKSLSYPFSTYKALLEHYITALLNFNVPKYQLHAHKQMVKKYACRLASSWFVANAVYRKKERHLFIEELKLLNKLYDIYDVRGLALNQKIVGKAILINTSRLQLLLLKVSLFVKKYEEAICRKFNFFGIKR